MLATGSSTRSSIRGGALFFKRFLKNPGGVADIFPSSPYLVNRVVSHMDLSEPRRIAEFGPGEGCITRKILENAHPETRIYLFELDKELATFLREQFEDEPRVVVVNVDCRNFRNYYEQYQLEKFDIIISGIPFSWMRDEEKRSLVSDIYRALKPESRFIVYQVSNELAKYTGEFDHRESEYCLLNVPPLVITTYHKSAMFSFQEAG